MVEPGSRRALGFYLSLCASLLALLLAANSVAAAEQLRVMTQNMNRLFDDIDNGNKEKILPRDNFRQRVESAANKFAEVFHLPHIIALQEIENRNVLAQIAGILESRYGADYRPLLLPGNDVSSINLGYLVRAGVEIRELDQLFRARGFGNGDEKLFSRPPLYLQACLLERCLGLLNLHLRSMRGIDDNRRGPRVRRKRLKQAESIATWINRRQQAQPRLPLLVLGDFNALTPPDEHVDVAGILRGNPRRQGISLRGRDLIDPDLVDLSLAIPQRQRYSFIFRRQKQQLDYIFVSQSFDAEVEKIFFSRIDYDFSDHAGLTAWFEW